MINCKCGFESHREHQERVVMIFGDYMAETGTISGVCNLGSSEVPKDVAKAKELADEALASVRRYRRHIEVTLAEAYGVSRTLYRLGLITPAERDEYDKKAENIAGGRLE